MDKKNFRVFWVVLYQEYIQSLKYMDSFHLFFSWHRKELRQKAVIEWAPKNCYEVPPQESDFRDMVPKDAA